MPTKQHQSGDGHFLHKLMTNEPRTQSSSIPRREALRVGAIGIGGLTLPQLLRLERATAARNAGVSDKPAGKAKSVIVLYLNGGPSQLDMWDMKPGAPVEVRGSFQPVPTNVPGIDVSEHLPRMATLADKYSVVRSMTHKVRGHPAANYLVMTGMRLAKNRGGEVRTLRREDRPHFGSVVAKLLGSRSGMPPFVMLPKTIQPTGPNDPHPGQFAGFLGPAWDPYLIDSNPNQADFSPGPLRRQTGISSQRVASRRRLLQQVTLHADHLQQSTAASNFDVYYEKAFDLISSPSAQGAFDVSAEPGSVREKYGRHVFGQSVLVARRLVEAGVRLVHVNWVRIDNGFGGQGYDSHSNHLGWSKNQLLPPTDAAFSSLVEDLSERGLLDETLVMMIGEFGRTPRFNKNGGRDHWPDCYSVVLAGGGVRGGIIHGSSDKTAAYPASNPTTPQDLLATLYHCLGISRETLIFDQQDRPNHLADGTPIMALL